MTSGDPIRVNRRLTYPVTLPGVDDQPTIVNVAVEEELTVEPSLDWELVVEIGPDGEHVTFHGSRGVIDDAVLPELLIHLLNAARHMAAGVGGDAV